MPQLPDWATRFNKGPRNAAAIKAAGLDETTQFYAMVGRTPAANSYEYHDGLVTLPDTAVERGGIQPVVHVTANGSARTEVGVGEAVTLNVVAEAPPATASLYLPDRPSTVDWTLRH